MQYTGTAVQQVQQQYSRFAVLVQQYSQYSCQRIGQRPVYCSTAVQHSTAVQQYSSSTAVQQTAGAQSKLRGRSVGAEHVCRSGGVVLVMGPDDSTVGRPLRAPISSTWLAGVIL